MVSLPMVRRNTSLRRGNAMTRRQQAEAAYPEIGQIIAGDFVSIGDRNTGDITDPATGRVLGQYAFATPEDLDRAIAGLAEGARAWQQMGAEARGRILHDIARTMRDRRQDLADLVTLELGKPQREALAEVEQAAGMWDWAAEEGRRAYGRIIPSRADGGRHMVLTEPLGPVAAFGSWNAPLITPSRKMSGALGAGCPIILKASEEVPACALAIGRIAVECGLPAGALSIVTGDAELISNTLLDAPEIRAVTFTGSTRIGKMLGQRALASMKRPILELGGHAPVLIFDDLDVEKVAAGAVAAKYRNAGQVCISPTRFFVQRGIYQDFVDAFASRARALTVGDGFDDTTDMGPLIDPRRIAATQEIVSDAKQRGLPIPAGGAMLDGPGSFHQPTVIADAGPDALVANQEPFGPIAAIAPFDDYDQAIALANRLPFALAAYVWSGRVDVINRAVNDIQAGSVIANGWRVSLPETPFGGQKESGLFAEGGMEGLAAFQQTKYAFVGG